MSDDNAPKARWYEGVTPYMWLVLTIASLGWIFDIFEGQIFVASMKEAMPSLLPEGTLEGTVDFYNNVAFAAFLVGGALGGVLFGMLSDRIGRTRTMILTILMYSLFTCVTALAQNWWQMAILRFLVAMGTGGEWAVASAMVAEVFPKRARAWSLGIFHGSSVLGTCLAVLAGAFVVGNENLGENSWRYGFLIGALPALLTLWIRWKLREPAQWQQARDRAAADTGQRTGRLIELFAPGLLRNTLVGLALATIGLATFWGVHVHGRMVLRNAAERSVLADLPPGADGEARQAALAENFSFIKKREMLGMFLVTAGGGLGLLSFAPICEWIGRRGTFLLFHLAGFSGALVLFRLLPDAPMGVLYVALIVFGYVTLGMHAGYAIYFPELFPTRLRGTGGGFCFNGGRLTAAPILVLIGWMQHEQGLGLSLHSTVSVLSFLFLLGVVVLLFAPETKGRDLPT